MTAQHKSAGRPSWINYIDEQLDWYRDHGIAPRQIVLGLDRYQELMQWLALQDGRDYLEAEIKWKDCLLAVVRTLGYAEVAGDINDIWERGEAFGMTPEAEKQAAKTRVVNDEDEFTM
jgi:hypothetical protein